MTPQETSPVTRRGFLAGAVGIAGIVAAKRAPAMARVRAPGDIIRIGFIGTGGRGMQMLKTLGYYHSANEKIGPKPLARLKRVEVVAVCDAFDGAVRQAKSAVKYVGGEATTYFDYRKMLEKETLDAVVIAAPDHHHAPAAIAAMEHGCDVYVEKCVANSLEDLFKLEDAIQRTGRMMQVGHQGRQDAVHRAAAEIVRRGDLGEVNLVRSLLSRGGAQQAWIRDVAKNGGPPRDRVHWELFLGPAPKREYDPRRFFEWRRYWDYSTGIAGDLMSHELDSIHHIMDLGVPKSAVASGGVYHWKDGRETPDTYSVVLEYPDRNMSVTYSANLNNNFFRRPTTFIGAEATMELDWEAKVFPDDGSTKYQEGLSSGELASDKAMIKVEKSRGKLLQSAATSNLWVQGRGLLMTTRHGKQVDTTRLHHQEFYQSMSTRKQPSASFESVYGSTVAVHLSVLAYKTGKKVVWDEEKREAIF